MFPCTYCHDLNSCNHPELESNHFGVEDISNAGLVDLFSQSLKQVCHWSYQFIVWNRMAVKGWWRWFGVVSIVSIPDLYTWEVVRLLRKAEPALSAHNERDDSCLRTAEFHAGCLCVPTHRQTTELKQDHFPRRRSGIALHNSPWTTLIWCTCPICNIPLTE